MKDFFIFCGVVPAAIVALIASTGCASPHETGSGGATSGSTAAVGAPTCGNGIIEPGEECDGMAPPWAPKGMVCNKQCELVAEVQPVINEIYYPQGAVVGCFLEIFYGSPGFDLSSYEVDAVGPIDGMPTIIAPLKGMTIGTNGYFVVVQDANVIIPMGVNSLMSPATHFMDGPGNVQLLKNGEQVDSLGWGFGDGVFVGQGSPAANPSAGGSLCRSPNGVHTMNNSADFKSCKPTPGGINFMM